MGYDRNDWDDAPHDGDTPKQYVIADAGNKTRDLEERVKLLEALVEELLYLTTDEPENIKARAIESLKAKKTKKLKRSRNGNKK